MDDFLDKLLHALKVILIITLLAWGVKILFFKNPSEVAHNAGVVRRMINWVMNLGNPKEYDRQSSVIGFAPLVFVLGGIYFLVQRFVREKIQGKSYEDDYRSFWKEEPFGGFHPEVEDKLGRVAGSDNSYGGRGMLGNKTYGKEAKANQEVIQEQQQIQQQGQQQYQNDQNNFQQEQYNQPNQYQNDQYQQQNDTNKYGFQ